MTETAPQRGGLEHILGYIDVSSMRGLEIGPLHNPVVSKQDGHSVFYVDHADTETLRQKYADHSNVNITVDVDYVWSGPLRDVVGDAAPFDYVIASHVIEHVPDLVSWLDELADVLRPGGVISLVIPDKRFCFDARRRTTEVNELVDAYLAKHTRPSLAQIYDFWAKYATVDAAEMWAGHAVPPPDRKQALDAYERCLEAMGHDDYVDVHVTTWTPRTFVDVLRELFELDLVRFRVAALAPTPFNSLEFYVTLERLDDDMPVEERRELQLASLPALVDDGMSDRAAVVPGRSVIRGRALVDVSAKELRAIQLKRRFFGLSRRAVQRVRRAARSRRPPG